MKVYIYISRFLILLYYGVYGSNMYMYVYYLKKNEMFLYFRWMFFYIMVLIGCF